MHHLKNCIPYAISDRDGDIEEKPPVVVAMHVVLVGELPMHAHV